MLHNGSIRLKNVVFNIHVKIMLDFWKQILLNIETVFCLLNMTLLTIKVLYVLNIGYIKINIKLKM